MRAILDFYFITYFYALISTVVSDIAIFVLKRDVKLQLTNSYLYHCVLNVITAHNLTPLRASATTFNL